MQTLWYEVLCKQVRISSIEAVARDALILKPTQCYLCCRASGVCGALSLSRQISSPSVNGKSCLPSHVDMH